MRAAYILISVMVALLSSPVAAGESDDKAAAIAHYERGTRLYQLREFADALGEFKAAYVAKPDPAFLFNIAQCHRNLGHTDEAATFYRGFLQHAPASDPNRTQVETLLRRTQDDAVFKEDLEPSASSPAVSAAALDSPFAADDARPTVAGLPPAPVPAEHSSARPSGRLQSAPGHLVHPTDRGYVLRAAGITCGAAGIVSIGAGIYFFTRAQHYSDVVSNDPNHTSTDVRSGQNAETAQWVFYGIGGASLAAGAVLSWLGWTAVRPMVGPDRAGLSTGGSF